ncbi:MAG TPA: prevent-host-death protein [Chromatiales bacterium]|nr:prevent-host-death protein [Chromatiales bacterium]
MRASGRPGVWRRLAERLLARAQVRIRRRDGSVFVLRQAPPETGSPLDVPGIRTRATTRDVLRAVREARARR